MDARWALAWVCSVQHSVHDWRLLHRTATWAGNEASSSSHRQLVSRGNSGRWAVRGRGRTASSRPRNRC